MIHCFSGSPRDKKTYSPVSMDQPVSSDGTDAAQATTERSPFLASQISCRENPRSFADVARNCYPVTKLTFFMEFTTGAPYGKPMFRDIYFVISVDRTFLL